MSDAIVTRRPQRKHLATGICLMMWSMCASAFQPTPSWLQQPTKAAAATARQMAALDPNDLANLASAIHHHHQHHDASTWDAILSMLYTFDTTYLKPAHGHSQPLFGPPDPWLTSGHSIPPSLKALDLAPATPPDPSQLPDIAKQALEKGYKVVDASKFEAGKGSVLPGFKPTHGILPGHDPNVPTRFAPGLQAFRDQVFFSARNWKLMEKLPSAAFLYAVIDFGFLRRNVDLYKEDIEEEGLEVAAETVAVTGVRLCVFFVVAFLTLVFTG